MVYLIKNTNKCFIYQLIVIIFVKINIFNYNKIIYSHKSINHTIFTRKIKKYYSKSYYAQLINCIINIFLLISSVTTHAETKRALRIMCVAGTPKRVDMWIKPDDREVRKQILKKNKFC